MAAADDIRCKRLVILKASSTLGTVLGQIIIAKRIVCDVGDIFMVCQTDDKAAEWTKTRGKEWLYSIPDVVRLISKEKYAVTNDLWQFRQKDLYISGPGINAAQSTQVRYLQTDESHLDAFPEGRLVEFEKRMGGQWNRQATHITTAPDAGREVDRFYCEGQQDEWFLRCPSCSRLVWPLMGDFAMDCYKMQVFVKMRTGVHFICPYCANAHPDTTRARYDMVHGGDYCAMNPAANIFTRSFRWSVFAAHWISWEETFSEYESSLAAAKLGNLKPLEDVTKKRFCMSWKAELPDFGEGKGVNDYKVGDLIWVVRNVIPESVRILTADYQAGTGDEGAHFWALVCQWSREGDSRRESYQRVNTFGDLEQLQGDSQVLTGNVYCDAGHESRLIYRECGKRRWYATRGSDSDEILHRVKRGDKYISFPMPYSQTEPQNGVVGQKKLARRDRFTGSRLPEGWAWQIMMCNPTLYGILSALVGGTSGRYFGIASNFPSEYVANVPAFVPVVEKNDKTGMAKRVVWRKVKSYDHAHDCETQQLVGAMRAGYCPLAKQIEQTT